METERAVKWYHCVLRQRDTAAIWSLTGFLLIEKVESDPSPTVLSSATTDAADATTAATAVSAVAKS